MQAAATGRTHDRKQSAYDDHFPLASRGPSTQGLLLDAHASNSPSARWRCHSSSFIAQFPLEDPRRPRRGGGCIFLHGCRESRRASHRRAEGRAVHPGLLDSACRCRPLYAASPLPPSLHLRVRRTDRYLDAPGRRGYHARSPRIACDWISTKGSLLPHCPHLARCLTSPRVNSQPWRRVSSSTSTAANLRHFRHSRPAKPFSAAISDQGRHARRCFVASCPLPARRGEQVSPTQWQG